VIAVALPSQLTFKRRHSRSQQQTRPTTSANESAVPASSKGRLFVFTHVSLVKDDINVLGSGIHTAASNRARKDEESHEAQ